MIETGVGRILQDTGTMKIVGITTIITNANAMDGTDLTSNTVTIIITRDTVAIVTIDLIVILNN